MELSSMLAGEHFSDRPRSVSPVIASLLRGYNDLVDDDRRQDLIRYASGAVGTAGSQALELARIQRLVRWADEHSAAPTRPGALGFFGASRARRVPPTDADSAGIYAIRSIHKKSRRVHGQVLELLDELIEMGDVHGPEAPRRSPRSIAAR